MKKTKIFCSPIFQTTPSEGDDEHRRQTGMDVSFGKSVANPSESGIIKSEGVNGMEQAKKRDHKVFVTREAIHRVDYVDIF